MEFNNIKILSHTNLHLHCTYIYRDSHKHWEWDKCIIFSCLVAVLETLKSPQFFMRQSDWRILQFTEISIKKDINRRRTWRVKISQFSFHISVTLDSFLFFIRRSLHCRPFFFSTSSIIFHYIPTEAPPPHYSSQPLSPCSDLFCFNYTDSQYHPIPIILF